MMYNFSMYTNDTIDVLFCFIWKDSSTSLGPVDVFNIYNIGPPNENKIL